MEREEFAVRFTASVNDHGALIWHCAIDVISGATVTVTEFGHGPTMESAAHQAQAAVERRFRTEAA